MNINLLKAFLALVKYDLNFTQAAESLGVTQPAVTKNIKTLEEILDAPLFMRKGRQCYQLTDKGQEILPVARSIVEQTLRLVADTPNRSCRTVLNIATTHTQIKYQLTSIVASLLKKYPDLTIHFYQAPPDVMAKMVATNAVDFAIATESFHLFNDIRVLPCYHWGKSLVVPTGHPLTHRPNIALADIAAWPLITYVFSCAEHSELYRAFGAQNLTPNIAISATDADIIKHYVRAGLGVGIAATCSQDKEDGLTFISLDHLLPGGSTSVLVNKNIWLSDVSCEFISLFAPHISEELICCFGNSQGSVKNLNLPWQ